MKTINVTIKQFHEMIGVKHQAEANSVMNMLVIKGIAKKVDSIRACHEDGRPKQGKPSSVYEIPQFAQIQLFEDGFEIQSQTEDVEQEVQEVETV